MPRVGFQGWRSFYFPDDYPNHPLRARINWLAGKPPTTIGHVAFSAPNIVVSYSDAADLVLEHGRSLTQKECSQEKTPLLTSLDRVLAQPIAADRDQPPFSRSTRDGFACRAADLNAARPLRIAGLLRSGQAWSGATIEPGETIEIMTGAPVPPNVDCVAMIEHVTVENGFVRPAARRSWVAGENIVSQGAEARAGDLLVSAGTRIQPQHIAIAASCGRESLSIYKPPRVAILATGDELVALNQTPLPHQIRNSNSYSLAAQVILAGCEPITLEAAADLLPAIEESIRKALSCDLILLSGGVSMGKYDFVEQALASFGAEFLFTGVRIQPGKPVVFGRIPVDDRHRYFFGLPGNPVSTMVTFALFAGPFLACLLGRPDKDCRPDFREAHLEAAIDAKPGLTRFLPAIVTAGFDGATVRLRPWQGSGDIAAAGEANCFVTIPDGVGLSAGERVTTLHL